MKVNAIKDTRTGKLVCVSRPSTKQGDIILRHNTWNHRATKLDGSAPYIVVQVEEGTPAEQPWKTGAEFVHDPTVNMAASPRVAKTPKAKKVKAEKPESTKKAVAKALANVNETKSEKADKTRVVAEADPNSDKVCPYSYDCEGNGTAFICTHSVTTVDKNHVQLTSCPGCYKQVSVED